MSDDCLLNKRPNEEKYISDPFEYECEYPMEYKYKYDTKGMYKKKNLPWFAIIIFDDSGVSDEDKNKFKTTDLHKYLTDESYRQEVKNKNIFILDNKYMGIMTMEEAFALSPDNNSRHFISVTLKIEKRYIETFVPSHKIKDYLLDGEILDDNSVFKTNEHLTEYKYETKGIYRKQNLPLFAILFFNNKGISDKEKKKFKTIVLHKYLTNESYRQEVKNKSVFLLDQIYVGIMTFNEARTLSPNNNNRYFIPIKPIIEQEYLESDIKKEIYNEKNYASPPYEYLPEYKYKYDTKGIYKKRKLPWFAKAFFDERDVSDEDKNKFKTTELYKYLTDENYREEIKNKKIFLLDNKYMGIMIMEEAFALSPDNNSRHFIPITPSVIQEYYER